MIGSEQLRILVADDSPVSRKALEHALENEACNLLFAQNGQEALQLVSQHRPHIVITDWMMPDLSGPEVCRRIREESGKAYIYIIVVTSSSDIDKLVEGLGAGADDYITKPFQRRELIARIGVGRRIIAMHDEIETKNRQLEEAARTDPLTGLPNRRAVEEYAQKQISGAVRHKFSLWVIAADLDRFKLINDTYGHAAGDEVLRYFATILKANTRKSDICGRLGGDEFIVMLTHAEKKDVAVLVERLGMALASHDFQLEGNGTHVSASFGFAGLGGDESKQFYKLMAEADGALYQVKASRRGEVAALKRGESMTARDRRER